MDGATDLDSQLEQAGDNRSEIEEALQRTVKSQRPGMRFLIRHMPKHDLQSLDAEFLLENVRMAYQTRESANWKISDELFHNYVLPYANVDETRDPWRKELAEISLPIVADCKTMTCAAQKLNQDLFKKVRVKYSTQRKKANQSPKESIDQGLASCTGLSILLVDACRSVGVPARLVGIPSWKNKRGNHTWVEIWDDGWHFTGAAEYDPQGLDRAWFQNDAAMADPNSRLNSIYAVSYKKTDIKFPLVWSNRERVFAENVTSRYLTSESPNRDSKAVSIMIRIWNADKTERKVFNVSVFDSSNALLDKGKTRGNTSDMNDMLEFRLQPETQYLFRIHDGQSGNSPILKKLQTTRQKNQVLDWTFDN